MARSSVVETPLVEPETVAEKRARPFFTPTSHLLAGALAVLLPALFMSFIFNRYIPINEGWFHYYSWLMHKGQMPYRDFWFFGQPVSLWIAWFVAGDHLINTRLFGLVERIVLCGMLYFLLSRQFSPKACFLATVTSMMVFLSYLTEGFFTYLVDSLWFLIAALICVYEAQTHSRHYRSILFLAGAFTSLCFFTKQSVGVFSILAVIVLIAWPEFELGRIINKLAYFLIGWIVAASPIVSWLMMNGAWGAYVNEVFKGAASAKGSFKTIFLTTLHRSMSPKVDVIFVAVAAVLALAAWRGYLVFKPPQAIGSTRKNFITTAICALVLIFTPILLPVEAPERIRSYMGIFTRVLFIGMIVLLLRMVIRRLQRPAQLDKPITVTFLVSGVLWAYGCGLSYKVEQHSIILGLAFLIAASCDNLSFKSGRSLMGLMTVLCLLGIGVSAFYKYQDAYDWNGWRSVISLKSRVSHWPQLAGFEPDPATTYMIDSILDDVAQESKPGDTIFTFPHMPIFNYVTGRPQPTFAPVHYWDVCPDPLAEADAQRVKAARPAVIVDMVMPKWLWDDGELTFRQGKRSGQRSIYAVIQEFAGSGDYRLRHRYWTPWEHTEVDVWQRIR